MTGGSSPLTRGKHADRAHGLRLARLIPAHAGKTLKLAQTRFLTPAHPRSRGENALPALKTFAAQGSSPLTRGKRHFAALTCPDTRLIPAHAGKTQARDALSRA